MTAIAPLEQPAPATEPAPGGPPWQRWKRLPKLWGPRVLAAVRSPGFAYLTILLLQFKVMWAVWLYKDLSTGDTSSYFLHAYGWNRDGTIHIAWSPLYTSFYGTVMSVTRDAFAVTILHRVLIALAATGLVLAVLRQVLPAAIAWLMAAWWAVLPINFNTLYEVHLFAVLPVLLAWLVLLKWNTSWGRGACLGIFAASTLLVRNELVIATGFLAVVFLVYEVRRLRQARAAGQPDGPAPRRLRGPVARTVAAYALPLVAAAGLTLFYYSRSISKFGAGLSEDLRAKHTVNMAQVYAFGYQQRHPEWTKNPWLESDELLREHFGDPVPTLGTMIRRNRAAVLEHFLWNLRLVPSGLQVLLFDATSGDMNPDYAAVNRLPQRARLMSAALLSVLLAGGALLWWDRRWWWREWIGPRALGWVAMLSAVLVAAAVIPTQRPRPSYLFSLSVLIMAVTGLCLAAILRRVGIWLPRTRRLGALMPVVMILALVMAPRIYWRNRRLQRTPMLATYRDLTPFQRLIARDDCGFLKGEFAMEVKHYLGLGRGTSYDYGAFHQMRAGESFEGFLRRLRVNLLFLDRGGLARLEGHAPGAFDEFASNLPSLGWRLIGFEETIGSQWMLFHKPLSGNTGWGVSEKLAAAIPSAASEMFSGWVQPEGLGPPEGPYPHANLPVVRWGYAPVSRIVPKQVDGGRFKLMLRGTTGAPGQQVTVKLDGRQVSAVPWPTGQTVEAEVPLELAPGPHEIEIGYSAWQESPGSSVKLGVLFQRIQLAAE